MRPLTASAPSVAWRVPQISWSSVDFPEPLAPMMPKVSPLWMSKGDVPERPELPEILPPRPENRLLQAVHGLIVELVAFPDVFRPYRVFRNHDPPLPVRAPYTTSAKPFRVFINHMKPKINVTSEKASPPANTPQSGVIPHRTTRRASSTKTAMGLSLQTNRNLSGTAWIG